MLAVDTETARIRAGHWWPELVCITACHTDGSPFFMSVPEFQRALDEGQEMCFHNAAFDLGVLWRAGVTGIFEALKRDQITDTRLRQKLIDLADPDFVGGRGYSLAWLSGGEKDSDSPWRTRFILLQGTPTERWPKEAREYALGDAKATIELWQEQDRYRKYTQNQYAQTRASFALACCSARGMRTDPMAIESAEKLVRAEYDAAIEVMRQHGYMREDGTRDMERIRQDMLEYCGTADTDVRRTETGLVALGKEALEVVEGEHPLVSYRTYTEHRKVLEDDLPNFRKGELWPGFDVLLKTGRTSSNKSRLLPSFQAQNLSKKPGIRECFVPRDGYHIVTCDYSQLELHTFAQTCHDLVGYSELGRMLNAETDVHQRFADMAGCSRQLAKAVNFGLPGGMGAKRLGVSIGVSTERAEQLRKTWFQMLPEAREYLSLIGQMCHRRVRNAKGETVQVADLYLPRAKRYRARTTFCAAANYHFQGLGADVATEALWLAVEEMYTDEASPLYGSHPCAFIHDEILLEAPIHKALEAGQRLADIMVSVGPRWTPGYRLKADGEVMTRWSKSKDYVVAEFSA